MGLDYFSGPIFGTRGELGLDFRLFLSSKLLQLIAMVKASALLSGGCFPLIIWLKMKFFNYRCLKLAMDVHESC